MKYMLLALLTIVSSHALAWGRIGHQIVCQTAANVVGGEPQSAFMKNHSFDFGYYCNVPDFIWKRPATYEQERGEHYVNFEVFEKAFAQKPEIKEPFSLSRTDFEKAFPEIKTENGRAFWRIRERLADLDAVTLNLIRLPEKVGKARQQHQEKWIVIAGTLGHYVGDLGMPLHNSENHDGQLSDQKGIHSFFEDACVDELYPKLQTQVEQRTRAAWSQFKKQNQSKSDSDLVLSLSRGSKSAVPELLKLDKTHGRKNVERACKAFQPLIEKQLVAAALTLAELYRRRMGFEFDDHRFYFFQGEPEFPKPGAASI